MLLDSSIEINVVHTTLRYWKQYDPNIEVGKRIVPVGALPAKSNYTVNCQCDICSRKYIQRFSRDHAVCGYCKTRERLLGNAYGKNNKNKYPTPSFDTLRDLVARGMGKAKLAAHFKVSIPVIARWLQEAEIALVPYFGRLYFKDATVEQTTIEKIRSYLEQDPTITGHEIAKLLNLPVHIVNKLKTENDIHIETALSKSRKQYDKIEENTQFYISENKTKTLKTIADEQNVSLDHLKRLFKDNDIPVQLHSFNKSKGELECKDFILSLGEHCYSAMIDKTYEIDCYVKDKNFGVEYCGEYWHQYIPSKNNKNYHRDKLNFCESKNITLMTIFANEWINKRSIIESMIMSRLGHSTTIYARKTKIKLLTNNEAIAFHNKNHINGGLRCPINIGLEYDGAIVAVISMIKSRFDKKYEYEILRFSSLLNHNVVGGLSKLLSYFKTEYNPNSIMTYADLRFGKGDSYVKAGFEFLGSTVPNYWYFHKNGDELESRMKYQKSKLVNMQLYDNSKTEYQIMIDSGYFRLYDCGSNKYAWIKKGGENLPPLTLSVIRTFRLLRRS